MASSKKAGINCFKINLHISTLTLHPLPIAMCSASGDAPSKDYHHGIRASTRKHGSTYNPLRDPHSWRVLRYAQATLRHTSGLTV